MKKRIYLWDETKDKGCGLIIVNDENDFSYKTGDFSEYGTQGKVDYLVGNLYYTDENEPYFQIDPEGEYLLLHQHYEGEKFKLNGLGYHNPPAQIWQWWHSDEHCTWSDWYCVVPLPLVKIN